MALPSMVKPRLAVGTADACAHESDKSIRACLYFALGDEVVSGPVYYLTAAEARALAAELVEVAGELEADGHFACSPNETPEPSDHPDDCLRCPAVGVCSACGKRHDFGELLTTEGR